jgi:ribosomal protein S18 acetylase RimI-like enzyme
MFKDIEELTLNHWQSLQTLLYDGWILRFADGYTKRANSINPIYQSNYSIDAKIAECERLYANQNLPTVFKITPFVCPSDIDSKLEQIGYSKVEPSIVKTVDLTDIREPHLQSVSIQNKLSEEWLEVQCRILDMSDSKKRTLVKIIANIQAPKVFISLSDENQVVSCGFGVIENNYVGLYNIVTDKVQRNKGYGEQLLLNLLKWAKQEGATKSYLQVVLDNQPAIKLYSKLGYREIYKYWYRVKGN